MDQEIIHEIKSYAKRILSSLEKINSSDSLRSLVPVFQDVVVTILQFSSKVYRVKKVINDEFKRESLHALLQSLKNSIPELSSSCQVASKSKQFSTILRKQEVISNVAYAVKQITKLIDHNGNEFGNSNPHRKLNMKQHHERNAYSRSFIDDDDDLQWSSLSLTASSSSESSMTSPPFKTICSSPSEFQAESINGNPFSFLSFIQRYKKIRFLLKKFGEEKGSNQQTSLHDGKRLLSKIHNFNKIASRLLVNKPCSDLQAKTNQLNELAADFVSMVIDFDNGSFLQEDMMQLLEVHRYVGLHLAEVLDIVKCNIGQEAILICNELRCGELIDETRTCVLQKNFIGLAESTCSFIEKSRESCKMLENWSGEQHEQFADRISNFNRSLQDGLTDMESNLDELLNNTDDKTLQNLLIKKMKEIVDSLADWRTCLSGTTQDAAISLKQVDCLVPNVAGDIIVCEQESLSKSNENKETSSFARLIAQFPKAVSDNDYRTVEILANRFLGNIKQVGDLLQRMASSSASTDAKDLRVRFEKYFKIAGSFCALARKAVFAEEDPSVMEKLIKTGKEMEERKNIFISSCVETLTPWIEISQQFLSCVDNTRKSVFLNINQRIKKMVENLSATEYFENSELKNEILKISTIIEKTADSLVNFTKAKQTQNANGSFLLEMFTLQWACAVICLLGMVDKISLKYFNETAKMHDSQLRRKALVWKSMLNDLAVCCSDEEASKEISDGIEELELILTKLKHEEDGSVETLEQKADVIVTGREFFSKILLLTELTDILTQDVRQPMSFYIDPLTRLSFAPNLRSYKAIHDAFCDKIDTIHTMSCLAVQDSPYKAEAHLVFVAADHLKNISEELISAVNSLDIATKKQINFFKMRWRVKATYLIKVLKSEPEVNYTAVAAVIRHLQSASQLGRYEELIAILNDEGSPAKNPYSKISRKSNAEVTFFDGIYPDDPATDFNSSMSSIADYSLSRDTDMLTTSSPRLETSELNFFRNYGSNLAESALPPTPLIQTPDTFNPYSSTSSVRSSSSQDTEIFVGRPARNLHSGLRTSKPENSALPDINRNEFAHSPNTNGSSIKFKEANQGNGDIFASNESNISKPIAAAARMLQRELEEWEEDGNSVITVVRQMTSQMLQMAEYARGRGGLRKKEDFINTAKAVAANANIVAKFAVIMADYCLDETCRQNLLHYAELVPTISTQLKIIASVKAATPDDDTADVMLIGNAENLMKSVLATLKAAESASVKMRQDAESVDGEPLSKSAALTLQWKKKLDLRRSMESITAETNELGLKIVTDKAYLSLADI